MFIMSIIFIGKDLIKKCQEIHQKSRNVQSCQKWKFRFTKNGKSCYFGHPTLELVHLKLKTQIKIPQGQIERSYSQLQIHNKNSHIGSKLRELWLIKVWTSQGIFAQDSGHDRAGTVGVLSNTWHASRTNVQGLISPWWKLQMKKFSTQELLILISSITLMLGDFSYDQ